MLPCHYEWLLNTKSNDVFLQASVSERNRKAREYLSRGANHGAAAASTSAATASTSAAAASTSAAAASTSAAAADDDGSANGKDGEWIFL